MTRLHRPTRWATALLTVCALLVFCSVATVTRSAWASGSVTNSVDTAATGSMSFTHTYTAGPACSAGPGSSSIACPGTLASGQVTGSSGLTSTDAITNNGNVSSASVSQTVAVSSCEPVAFANTNDASNAFADRYGTTFNQTGPFTGAGSVVFNGSTGYATSVVVQTQPPSGLLSAGTFSGIGIWFKAASGTSGPLFSFGASAANGTGNVDRTLYLNTSGQLTFVWNTGGTSIGPTTVSGGFADGNWHFAYLVLGGINVVLVGLIPQVSLYVDGTQRATTPLLSLSPFSSYAGFWHLGYAPTATTGLATAYFGGSLSDFVVFDGSTVPPASNPNSASTFATFAAAATEWLPLNDTGGTTFTGTLPVVGAGSGTIASAACKSLDLGWAFAGPSGNATSSATSLYSWVTSAGSISSVGAPGPGTTQSATLTLSHDTSYNSYVAGLHLWVPMTSAISVSPGARWALTFGWTPAPGTTIIPTT